MFIFYIILGYLLGSIPFGYIFSKISGKDILNTGWRKTSTSNVFKNVGIWQGVLSGLGDIGKGCLSVWLAKNSGFSIEIQALCGLSAVIGHNWSCFLKFAGGRGLATLMGAFLILSPKIFGLSLIPLLFFTLIWNAAIGTLLFLITSIIISFYFGQLKTIGLLPLLSFLPLLLKRLSPINELFLSSSAISQKFNGLTKKEIIKNRLIFDDSIPDFELRIKKWFRRLTKQ